MLTRVHRPSEGPLRHSAVCIWAATSVSAVENVLPARSRVGFGPQCGACLGVWGGLARTWEPQRFAYGRPEKDFRGIISWLRLLGAICSGSTLARSNIFSASLSMQWLLFSVVSAVYFTQLACSLCRRRKLCAGAGNRGLSLQGRPEIAASASPRCDMVRSGFMFLCLAPVCLDLTCGLTNLSWVHRA